MLGHRRQVLGGVPVGDRPDLQRGAVALGQLLAVRTANALSGVPTSPAPTVRTVGSAIP